MASRDTLAQRCAPFLPARSEIRQAFIGQAFIGQTAPSPWFFLITYLTGLTMPWIKYRCVAVTPAAIVVRESSKSLSGATPKSLVGTTPRQTRPGKSRPPTTKPASRATLSDEAGVAAPSAIRCRCRR